jgi:hypothetical protein
MIANIKNSNTYFHLNAPAIVDLLPTMLRFQKINIPQVNEYELDGVPIIGNVSMSHPSAEKRGDSLIIHWKAYEKNSKVRILVSYTNLFKEGQEDHYETLATVAVEQEQFSINIDSNKRFAKFVLVGKYNTINTQWHKK